MVLFLTFYILLANEIAKWTYLNSYYSLQDFDTDAYVDIFKNDHGEIHMSEIELNGAAEVVQSMMQSS